MKCWLCSIEVDQTNSSGSRNGKPKNECVMCHSVYTLFLQLEKKTHEELGARLMSLSRTVEMYKLIVNNPSMKAKDLSKLYLEG